MPIKNNEVIQNAILALEQLQLSGVDVSKELEDLRKKAVILENDDIFFSDHCVFML